MSLTDSVGHTVKEDPSIIGPCEADIVAGLNADDREEVKLVDFASIWGYIHDHMLVTFSTLSMSKLGTLFTEVDHPRSSLNRLSGITLSRLDEV